MSDFSSQGDLLQTPATDPIQSEVASLRQRVHHLRIWVYVICAAVIPLAISVDSFLARQLRTARAQLPGLRLQVERDRAVFERRDEANYRKFFEQLHLFAATNRDFQPLLDRYRPYLGQLYPVIAPTPTAPPNLPPPPAPE